MFAQSRSARNTLSARSPRGGPIGNVEVMYHEPMRRLQISIEPELDEALAVEASRRKMSKAAVIRELVRQQVGMGGEDPMQALVGDIDDEAGDIDSVVYSA